jgi:hypothetical protein
VKLCFAVIENNQETVAHDLSRHWEGYRMPHHAEEVQQARIGVWSIQTNTAELGHLVNSNLAA